VLIFLSTADLLDTMALRPLAILQLLHRMLSMLTAGLKLLQTCAERYEALAQFSKTTSCQTERLLVYLRNQATLFSLTKEFLTMSLSQLLLKVKVLHDVSSPFQVSLSWAPGVTLLLCTQSRIG
jgi:hypothetical protein